MLSLVQRLGRLRHQVRSVYRLRNEIDEIGLMMMQKQKHIEQIKTVVAIQTNDVRETVEKSKNKDLRGAYVPPVNLVYVCSEIARREDELAEGIAAHREAAKTYAYKLYCLQTLHNSIIDLAQSTQDDARMFAIPFDFDACFQAVQDTSVFHDAQPAEPAAQPAEQAPADETDGI